MTMKGHNKPKVDISSLAPEEKKRLKKCIIEMNDSMTRQAAEKEFQKETLSTLNEELGIDKKLLRKIAKAYYNVNIEDERDAFDDFVSAYEIIVKA